MRTLQRLALALLVACLVPTVALGADRRPNVVLIISDDQGYGDLHCHGNTMIRTPSLDRLYEQSVRLTDFHVDPTCSPTRAALLTGRYSTRTGVWHTVMGRSLLAREEVTLADMLSAAGYRTAILGKWHLGDNYPLRPQDRGFQAVLVHGGGGIGQTPDYWGNDYFDDTYFHNGRPEKFGGYCTDVFFQQAIDYIGREREHPFFVYLPTNVPHGPYNVDEKYSRPYRDRGVPDAMANFYGMIENLDENVGRLLARLDEWRLAEDTIVIFMTDNGTAAGVARGNRSGSGAWQGFSAGMRGQKGSAYEGGHRVPCFIRYPRGGIGGGRDVSRLAAHVDLLPTLAELCAAERPRGRQLDGQNLAPLLRDGAVDYAERTLFVHSQRIESPEKWRQSAVMQDSLRLIDGKQLYDLANDPSQEQDIAAERPETVRRLRDEYETWWKSLEPAFERYVEIVVGSEVENPTQLNCMDWHADMEQIPWNQQQVKAAPWANGYWMIDVAAAGTYEFTLRQQPATGRFPIEATRAKVRAGDVEESSTVPKAADSVTLQLDLAAGPQRLETWLSDEATGKSRGAFFVEIRRLP